MVFWECFMNAASALHMETFFFWIICIWKLLYQIKYFLYKIVFKVVSCGSIKYFGPHFSNSLKLRPYHIVFAKNYYKLIYFKII